MNKAKKFFQVYVTVDEDFGRNGNTWGYSPIRVEEGKVALAWSNYGGLEWWGDSSDVSDDETFAIDDKVRDIVADYLKYKSLAWWKKVLAEAEEKGAYDLKCRLPKRKGFAIAAEICCQDAEDLEDLPEDYAGFVKFLGVELD